MNLAVATRQYGIPRVCMVLTIFQTATRMIPVGTSKTLELSGKMRIRRYLSVYRFVVHSFVCTYEYTVGNITECGTVVL